MSPETKSPGAINWSRVICSACGRRDLNPHDIAITRSLVLLVCQFRHFRSSLYEVIALSLSRRLDYNIKKVVECQPLFSIFLIFLLLFTAGFCGGSRRTPSNRRLLASKMRQTRVSAVGLRSDWGGAVNSNIFLFKRESSGLQPPLFELILRQRLVVEEALDHVYVHAFQYILLSVPLDAFYHDIQVHGIGKLRHRAHESI